MIPTPNDSQLGQFQPFFVLNVPIGNGGGGVWGQCLGSIFAMVGTVRVAVKGKPSQWKGKLSNCDGRENHGTGICLIPQSS